MKIVRYDDDRVGLLRDGNVIDVSDVVPKAATPQLTIEALIANFSSLKGAFERELGRGRAVPVSGVRLRAPVPRPGRSCAWAATSASSSAARACCGAS